MKGELIWTTTSDRTRLHGFFVEAHQRGDDAVDAAILLHGLAGNFYSSGLLNHLARVLVGRGISVLLANSRGHDILNLSTQMGRSVTLGAANEDVAECRFDLAGWVQVLTAAGHERILLVGHSLGAIKAMYSQAFLPDPRVAGIAALSATRLNYDLFMSTAASQKFAEIFRQASEWTKAGRGADLMRVEFPFPTWMTAESYVSKYGPENRFDWTSWVGRISPPVLLTFGERELAEHPAFRGLEPVAREIAQAQSNIQFEVIPNADHFYIGCLEPLSATLEKWLVTFG